MCACVSVPGLRNLGNEVEQSIRAVTIRRPVEHGKLQLLPSACLNEHIQLNTQTYAQPHTNTLLPSLMMIYARPGRQACITVTVTNTHRSTHTCTLSKIHRDAASFPVALSHTHPKEEKNDKMDML